MRPFAAEELAELEHSICLDEQQTTVPGIVALRLISELRTTRRDLANLQRSYGAQQIVGAATMRMALDGDQQTEALRTRVGTLVVALRRVVSERRALRKHLKFAHEIVARGVELMPLNKLGLWEGVRAWQEWEP